MTDKQKIKQEIENQRNEYNKIWKITHSDDLESHIAYANRSLLDRLLKFIDSLPEEPVSEGIENELERFVYSLPHSADGFWPKDIDCKSAEARTKYGVHHAWSYEQVKKIARHFADWKESQLMKDGIEGEIGDIMPLIEVSEMNNYLNYVKSHGLKPGDKVKVILIKEEEK